ncbi:MAG: bifunctional folylpolyglutamate synthase/dihydrofolate synthase [Firmicutes bacterium]|nr:bifunctional folylpolyglutamate synthase/dihydrofolate synthase [Bacillota bacterium]
MTFDEAIAYLDQLTRFGIRPGLERTQRLLAAIGNPERHMKHVHVAGTNGKGSAAVMVESVLRHAGYRTGLFTSPHLQRYTERIRVDGKEIPQAELASILQSLVPAISAMGEDPDLGLPTEFEVCTALCFEWFRRAGVEIAVVEVGLGGRYDSTNVVMPEVGVITHIALDHMERLGRTLGEIAWDKAGILKPGIPAVVAPQEEESERVLKRVASDVGAPVVWTGRDVTWNVVSVDVLGTTMEINVPGFVVGTVRTSLPGRHQAVNCAVAVTTLGVLAGRGFPVPREALEAGLIGARNPGRFEVVDPGPPLVILDGAHNPDGAHALASAVGEIIPGRPRVLVLGCSRDKPLREMVEILAPLAEIIIGTEASHTRSGAADPEEIVSLARQAGREAWAVIPARAAASEALGLARSRGAQAVLIAGSLYLIGEVRGMWRD